MSKAPPAVMRDLNRLVTERIHTVMMDAVGLVDDIDDRLQIALVGCSIAMADAAAVLAVKSGLQAHEKLEAVDMAEMVVQLLNDARKAKRAAGVSR